MNSDFKSSFPPLTERDFRTYVVWDGEGSPVCPSCNGTVDWRLTTRLVDVDITPGRQGYTCRKCGRNFTGSEVVEAMRD